MARISNSFSTGNWKMRTKMTMSLEMGTTPPRERRKTMSRLRRTQQQGVSYALGRLMKTTMETTARTLTMEPIVMMAPPVMTVLEMMAVTGAAVMVMSAQVLRSSAVGS
jgi:hypothetical protein